MKIPRLPKDQRYILFAHLTATSSTCDRGPELLLDPGRHGVGAVIVKENRIIAGGYNGSPPGESHCTDVGHVLVDGHCVKTLHAEENAILQCALDGVSPRGATVYTTAGPCYDCAKRLIRVEIKRVVYASYYSSRYDLSVEALALLKRASIRCDQVELGLLG